MDQDYTFNHVPAEARRSWWPMLTVMLGFTFFSSSMWTGARLGAELTFKNFIFATLVGNLFLGAYTGTLAYIACKTGLSTHLLTRYSFGYLGSKFTSAVLTFTQVGWFGVGVAMFAIPVKAAIPSSNEYVLCVLAGAAMTATAFWGIKALTLLSIIAVPLIAVFGLVSSSMALVTNDGLNIVLNNVPEVALPMSLAITLSVGNFISGGTITGDFARFAKNSKIAVFTTILAFFLGNSLMFFFGAIGANLYQTNDISIVMQKQGLLIAGILVLGFNIWTTNDNALYTSGLGLSNITHLPKKLLVIIAGVAGTAFSMWLYNNFCAYLAMLSTFIPPIGAIIIADYFILHHKRYDFLEKMKFPPANWPALLAWLSGSVCAMNWGEMLELVTGQKLNIVQIGIAPVNGVVVSFVGYLLFSYFHSFIENKRQKNHN